MLDLQIVEAKDRRQLEQVAALMRDYFLWLRRRYVAQTPVLDSLYDERKRQRELADLPGHYQTIMLAVVDGVPAGCVMLRRIDDQACEMKRLFVRPAFQNQRIAHSLICKLATTADALGYRAIRLETGPLQFEAQGLYASLGFKRIAPYYAAAGWLKDNMLFFEGAPRDVAAAAACKRPQLSIAA